MNTKNLFINADKINAQARKLQEHLVLVQPDEDSAGGEADILPILLELATIALNAYIEASGTPITADSVLALLPDSTPLTPPPAGS